MTTVWYDGCKLRRSWKFSIGMTVSKTRACVLPKAYPRFTTVTNGLGGSLLLAQTSFRYTASTLI